MDWTMIWTAVAALGTVAAVVLSLWFASGDSRRRKKDADEAKLRASLFAASMMRRLYNTRFELQTCVTDVRANTNMDVEADVLRSMQRYKDLIEGPIFLPGPEDLIPLLPLGENCAHRIATAVGTLLAFRRISTNYLNPISPEQARGLVKGWGDQFMEAAIHIAYALRTFEQATKQYGPPPIRKGGVGSDGTSAD